MPIYLCKTCGTSYAEAPSSPEHCPICEDERQYVPLTGQAWTTPEELDANHVNSWRRLEPSLFEIHTQPDFAIGQRALLIQETGTKRGQNRDSRGFGQSLRFAVVYRGA